MRAPPPRDLRRSEFRVIVSGLPPSVSWQDLKDFCRPVRERVDGRKISRAREVPSSDSAPMRSRCLHLMALRKVKVRRWAVEHRHEPCACVLQAITKWSSTGMSRARASCKLSLNGAAQA